MKKIKTDILPLAISILLILISLGITATSDYILGNEHYIGIGFLLISTILYFTTKKVYYLFFALTLTIGLVGFLDFLYLNVRVGFAGVGINPVFLGLMILFFAVSRKEMDTLAPDKNKPKERTLNENLIKSFESKFMDKTVAELKEIMGENSKFTGEAKEAAKRMLDEKNVL